MSATSVHWKALDVRDCQIISSLNGPSFNHCHRLRIQDYIWFQWQQTVAELNKELELLNSWKSFVSIGIISMGWKYWSAFAMTTAALAAIVSTQG